MTVYETEPQKLEQEPLEREQLEAVRRARGEIMRIADPEDAYVTALIQLCGPTATADYLTGRRELTVSDMNEFFEAGSDLPQTVMQGLYDAVQHRLERWTTRRQGITAEQDARFAAAYSAWLCVPEDQDWPAALHDLAEKAPYGLWGRGDRRLLKALRADQSVAVVGSRDLTSYGTSATSHLAGDLASAGNTIISGGAFGVDATAHRTALAVSTARLPTVAFMACGVDRFYPRQNEKLLDEILQGGLIFSEVPLGQSPTRYRFLQRNRLIAAISSATVVVEARWRSGALNTANHALELGRPVYAVPGPIFSPSSEGCHRLIRDGLAQLLTDARQIERGELLLSEEPEASLFGPASASQQLTDCLRDVQRRVWDALPVHRYASVDKINAICGLPLRELLVSLSQLKTLELAETNGAGWRKKEKR
ncbi:DNA-processing protein DprA [Rothia sp. P100]|uniref:DNA-processing protein DprA n=1 Tax=Rothia sp. P100 TaxID=2939578 RepID=UPI00203E1BA0|nr:DNA-processing protein DprA [Rothia sp. P100]MCM3509299.1 DNA-processing protein DprA [Rothia sp. P100]